MRPHFEARDAYIRKRKHRSVSSKHESILISCIFITMIEKCSKLLCSSLLSLALEAGFYPSNLLCVRPAFGRLCEHFPRLTHHPTTTGCTAGAHVHPTGDFAILIVGMAMADQTLRISPDAHLCSPNSQYKSKCPFTPSHTVIHKCSLDIHCGHTSI